VIQVDTVTLFRFGGLMIRGGFRMNDWWENKGSTVVDVCVIRLFLEDFRMEIIHTSAESYE
jgi:hypothetical protein